MSSSAVARAARGLLPRVLDGGAERRQAHRSIEEAAMGRARRRTTRSWRWLAMAAWLALLLAAHARADVLYLYDDAGRLTGVIDETSASAGYRYDASGNVIAVVRSGAGGPAITSFAPASGGSGAAVTINGTGFAALAADNRVTFNGVPAMITSSATTRIVAKVPVGAASGPLTVTSQAVSARSAASFTVTAPNLVPTALTAPGTVSPRQPIAVSWTVANRGTGAAAPRWSDVVYLSRDPMCCRADQIAAAVESTSTVAAGQSYTRTQTVPAPRVPAGQYFLILSVDDGRVVPESDETNNRRALPIAITTANLEPTGLTLPTTWTRGQSVSATVSVANRGTGTAYGAWDDGLYLVPEGAPCCDSARLLVAAAHTTPLAPGASYSSNAPFKVPADVATGRYHVVLVSDFRGVVTEASEGDNQRRVLVTIMRRTSSRPRSRRRRPSRRSSRSRWRGP
jgi:YD repeat-containing protein